MTQTGQITSIKDPRIAEARELTAASARASLHKCLLEGSESIGWALASHLPIEHIFYSVSHEQNPILTQLHHQRIPCYIVSDGILKKISDTWYLVPFLAVARIPHELINPDTMGDFVVVLDRVQDHGNIGTIIRTASAFGIRDIVSTTPTLDLFYKKIVSASRGRAFETRVQRYSSGSAAIAALKERGYQVIATSPYARDIQAMAPLQARPVALVVGNETEGIADDIVRNADIVVQIPMSGQVESLNVGVATGISLYELKFRMVLTMLINYIRSNTGRAVNVTGKLILQAFDSQIRKVSDLSGQQAILLMILVCDQQMTREQAMRDTGALETELDDLLTPLIEKGYIRYTDDEQKTIIPTETSERTLAQLWSVVERAEQNILTGFSEQEKEQLRVFLQRIQENCTKIIAEP